MERREPLTGAPADDAGHQGDLTGPEGVMAAEQPGSDAPTGVPTNQDPIRAGTRRKRSPSAFTVFSIVVALLCLAVMLWWAVL